MDISWRVRRYSKDIWSTNDDDNYVQSLEDEDHYIDAIDIMLEDIRAINFPDSGSAK